MTYMKKRRTELCVVGGGAAGLMAAVTAAAAGADVLVAEREAQPARKLRITGKGRCNVTNDCGAEDALRHVTRNGRFLYSAMYGFPPAEVMAFFERLGVPLKTERGNRVFPVSDKASDVAEALLREAQRLGVAFETCRAAILCTGGLSYPKTGSTGDGYRMAQVLGHTLSPTRPSLVPLTSDDPDCAAMQGLSLRNVTLTLVDGRGKPVWSELGELQFTHFGVTGPLVLSASAHMQPDKPYSLELDLKPGLDEQKLDARLVRLMQENRNRDYKNALEGLLPRLLEPVVVARSGIPPEQKANGVTRAQRAALMKVLKQFTIPITGTRPIDEAVITCGGIPVREVEPGSLASRLVSGLYFAGEILDVDAYTGGYNLQIAWCTGRAAGLAAAARIQNEKEQQL